MNTFSAGDKRHVFFPVVLSIVNYYDSLVFREHDELNIDFAQFNVIVGLFVCSFLIPAKGLRSRSITSDGNIVNESSVKSSLELLTIQLLDELLFDTKFQSVLAR